MSSHPSNRPSETYQLEVDRSGPVVVVKLTGSVNMDVCDDVRDRLIKLVDEQPTTHLVLDLQELEFICSVGLGGIIAAHVRCRHHNGGVKLVSPTAEIKDLLAITKLTKLFPIYESLEAAIAAK